jgi:dCTP deaminase
MLAEQRSLRNTGYLIAPDEFILAQSREIFNLPDHISAEYKLKSSMARIGLDHLNAGWCDAGWNGSVLTLELKNLTRYHEILIQEGDAIGQMILFSHTPVPPSRSYAVRGRYNGDKQVSGAKNASPRKDS